MKIATIAYMHGFVDRIQQIFSLNVNIEFKLSNHSRSI